MAKVEKLKSGMYSTRVFLGRDATGKVDYRTVHGASKKDVLRKAAELRAEYAKMPGEIRLGDALYKYVESRNDTTLYSPTTYSGYLSNYRSLKAYAADYMRRDMRDIKSDGMEDLFRLLSQNLSAKTLRNIRGLLSGTYKMAGIPMPDLTDTTHRLLSTQKKTISVQDAKDSDVLCDARYFPTSADIVGVIRYAMGHRPDLVTPIALAAYCGLRRSEICGLRMSDFDFEKGTVTISRAMVKTAKGDYVYTDTKTKGSMRTVPVPSALIERITIENTIYDNTPKSLSDAWEHVIAGAVREGLAGGVFRFHDLRHFAAAWWMTTLHFDVRLCMDLGGWTEQATLLKIYAYVLSDAKSHAADNINRYGNDFLREAGL